MASEDRAGLTVPVIAVNATALLLAIGFAVSTLWPVYQSPAFIVTASVSAVLGVAIATLGAILRWSSLIVLLVTVGVYLTVGVPLGVPSEATLGVIPTVEGFVDLIVGTATSWKQLLTIVTPVGSYQALLIPVLVLVLSSAVIGMSIALRARRGELAVLAPLALFIVAILLGPTTAQAPIETALCLGIVLVLWATWVHRRRRRDAIARLAERGPRVRETATQRRIAGTRTFLSAAVVIAIAVAGATAAAVVYPSDSARDVLRRYSEQPFDPRDYPSPLSAFRSYLQPENAGRTMLTVSGLPTGGRIRLAALDTYDGIVYSVGSEEVTSASGSFTRLPYRIDQSAVDGEDVEIDVTVAGYRGVWAPGVGELESIRFVAGDTTRLTDAFFYNDNSATGAVLGGFAQGDRYRSRAVVPTAVSEIRTLRPGTAVLPPVGVEPEGLDAALAAWADPSDSPGDQLAAMVAGLKRDGYVSHGIGDEPANRSGHAADRITQLVTDVPMLGDGEQYAVAATLMARMIGFPARVVVGFVPAVSASTGPVAVSGSDISAWMEVQDSRGVWVAVDPNPEQRPVPEKEPDQPNIVSRPQVILPPPPEDPRRDDAPAQPQNVPEEEQTAIDPVLAAILLVATVLGWTVLALAILASPFLAIIVAKVRRRRHRRRAPNPIQRIEGGWREFSDLALDRGIDPPAAATRAETAVAVGGMRPLVLAAAVDRAVFAPDEPTEADVERVWTDVEVVRASLDEHLTAWQRLRAMVSLRSFRPAKRSRRRRV